MTDDPTACPNCGADSCEGACASEAVRAFARDAEGQRAVLEAVELFAVEALVVRPDRG